MLRKISIGNQVFPYQMEAQRPSGEVGASAAYVRKRNESINGVYYFRNDPVGGGGLIRSNEVPNLVKIMTDFRMKFVRDHEPGGVWRTALFSRK